MEEATKSKEELMGKLKGEIENCKKCGLWKTRNKPLVGDGSVDAEILVIGESPGYKEDLQGRAFVGEAGKVLDRLLDSVSLKRSDIYITNILKCHPPKNHNPSRYEIDACIEYLYQQIDIIKPRIIATLGKYASREIFAKFDLEFSIIGELHGKEFNAKASFGNVKIIPLYHPAVACYHSETFTTLEEDFKKFGNVLRQMKS